MADYIVIDGGTTNTRISLVNDYSVIDTIKLNSGAQKNIDNIENYKIAIRDTIADILNKNCKTVTEIKRILASGMITSEHGLLNLEHIPAPAGIKELHESMVETVIPEISSQIPFVFIRGVKNYSKNLEDIDIMRGEETELMGICECEEGVYILPGSHSKIIITDKKGRIFNFKTMLSGEMISALAEHTILKASFNLSECELDNEYLLKGYYYALNNGINDALFKVRILKNVFSASSSEAYSFFLGTVLCDEIKYIINCNSPKITIGGKKQIKEALSVLLKSLCDSEIETLTEEQVQNSNINGIIKIYEYKNELA